MKTPWGNIGKINTTEDKIVRVDATESELDSNPVQQVLGINELLPQLSILQLSDVWLKTKKTFKGKAGKALVVWEDERSIEFGEWWGGWGWCNVDPITLTYAPVVNVDLWINVNYVITLTWDCIINLWNIVPWCVYQFLVIQDSVWGHSLSFGQPVIYSDWYLQNLSPWNISKVIVDNINWQYFASIQSFGEASIWRNAWVRWNSSEGVISVSADWITWYTIADKNLWATSVYTSWATLSETNCGKFYQWWNNYWFPYWTSQTWTNTHPNSDSYWPWNYYNSNWTFIGYYNWTNIDMWWWDTNTNASKQWPCDSWWHIPTQLEFAKVFSACLSLWISELEVVNYLKIPKCWMLDYDWEYLNNNTANIYFSDWTINTRVEWFTFYSWTYIYWNTRSFYWYSIRPFKNTTLIPWSWGSYAWWTKLFW